MATTATAPRASHPWYSVLYIQVLIAIAVGVVVGHLWPDFGKSLKPLGDGFIAEILRLCRQCRGGGAIALAAGADEIHQRSGTGQISVSLTFRSGSGRRCDRPAPTAMALTETGASIGAPSTTRAGYGA